MHQNSCQGGFTARQKRVHPLSHPLLKNNLAKLVCQEDENSESIAEVEVAGSSQKNSQITAILGRERLLYGVI